ncbi:MAG: GNAT family N-acetyltransferase [Bryobacteraceae bacterium]|nr:GNAT family N-acetyltransferase [Bryobacteraceae bacterium]
MSDIRLLTPADLPALMRLNQAARWNQVEEDWRRLLELEPDGCFGIECDGRIVSTATAVCHGRRLAWIGMVLTDPDYRRRGYGRELTARAIRYANEEGVEWIKLDATDMGRPIYLDLGFEDEGPIERWSGVAAAAEPAGLRVRGFDYDRELDAAAFGADRRALLESLARGEAFSILGEGFAMARPGANSFTVGPCVARSRAAARELIAAVLVRHPGAPFYWDLLPANEEAVRLAGDLGFTPVRKLVRMALRGERAGAPPANDDSLVYAAAGFEYG